MTRLTFSGPTQSLKRIVTIAVIIGSATFIALVVMIILYLNDRTFPLFIPFVMFALYYPITAHLNKKIKAYRYSLVIDENSIEKIFHTRRRHSIALDSEYAIVEKRDGLHLYNDDEEIVVHASIARYDEIVQIIQKKRQNNGKYGESAL